MADRLIQLDKKIPGYANPFIQQALVAETVQFEAVDGKFTVSITNADLFFSDAEKTEKFTVDSSSPASKFSSEFTIKNNLRLNADQFYYVYCYDQENIADAPPRIIIVPYVATA